MIAPTDDPRVDELLLRWEELREAGQCLCALELCSTCPELAGELERRIELLCKFDPLLDDTGITGPRHTQTVPGPAGMAIRDTAAAPGRAIETCGTTAAGALGEVFLAHNAELNRDVALKFLKPGRARDPESLRRFLREAEITGRLEHPGVVPIYALGNDSSGAPCYAMRFIRGLRHSRTRSMPFTPPRSRAGTHLSARWRSASFLTGSRRSAARWPTRTTAESFIAI